MLTLIWRIFTNEAAFSDLWHEKGAVIMRLGLFGLGLAVHAGVIPGGDSTTGWYASLAAMAGALGIQGGDKNAADLYTRLDALEAKAGNGNGATKP